MPAADEISIIAGGPSARDVDLAALPGTIICVNDAAMHAPRCDIIVSMDRLWLENRWTALEHLALPTFVRLSAMCYMLDRIYREWVHPFENRVERAEFGNHLCTLNGANSGYAALNLAFVMKPRRVHLVGFDMGRNQSGEAYWFANYSWARKEGGTGNGRYREWAQQFGEGLIQLRNAGIETLIYRDGKALAA